MTKYIGVGTSSPAGYTDYFSAALDPSWVGTIGGTSGGVLPYTQSGHLILNVTANSSGYSYAAWTPSTTTLFCATTSLYHDFLLNDPGPDAWVDGRGLYFTVVTPADGEHTMVLNRTAGVLRVDGYTPAGGVYTCNMTGATPWIMLIRLYSNQSEQWVYQSGTWTRWHVRAVSPGALNQRWPAGRMVGVSNQPFGASTGPAQVWRVRDYAQFLGGGVNAITLVPEAALFANGTVASGGTIAAVVPAEVRPSSIRPRSENALIPGAATYPGATAYPGGMGAVLGTPRVKWGIRPAGLPPTLTYFGRPILAPPEDIYVEEISRVTAFGRPAVQMFLQSIRPIPQLEIATRFGSPSINVEQFIRPPVTPAPSTMFGTPEVFRAPLPAIVLPSRTGVRWKLVIADRGGNNLADITSIALDRRVTYRLNEPDVLSFRVPSDHEVLRIATGDGYPLLWPLNRYMKAYREEYTSRTDPALVSKLRFCGPIWQMQDDGSVDAGSSTAVTAFGVQQILTRRACIDSRGYPLQNPLDPGGQPGPVGNWPIGWAVYAMLEWSKGIYGLPIDTVYLANTGTYPIDWRQRTIYDAMQEAADMYGGVDYQFVPKENARSDLYIFNYRGVDRPNAVFTWDAPGSNCSAVSRSVDAQTYANQIIAIGTQLQPGIIGTGFHTGPADGSIGSVYGWHQQISAYPDMTGIFQGGVPSTYARLEALGSEELAFRARLREIISWVPQAGRAPEPFVDYDVGDTVRAYAGARLRGGFGGAQRVYGMEIAINNEGVENVAGVLTSP